MKDDLFLTNKIKINTYFYYKYLDKFRDIVNEANYSKYGFNEECINHIDKYIPECEIIGYLNRNSVIIKVNDISYKILKQYKGYIINLDYQQISNIDFHTYLDYYFDFNEYEKRIKLVIKCQILR